MRHKSTETSSITETKRDAILRGETLYSQKSYSAALDVFDELVSHYECAPSDGIWGRIAACLRKLARHEELDTLAKTIDATGRPHVQVVLQLALARAAEGKVDEALSELESVVGDYEPDQQADILRIRSEIQSAAGRHKESLRSVASMFELGTPAADSWARFSLALAERKQRQAALAASRPAARLRAYWEDRRNSVYIHVCRQLIKIMGRSAKAVADIGSNQTPTLDFYPGCPLKYSVDPGSPYESHDVTSVREDFLKWAPPEPIHFLSCLQVMEHVADATSFAARLLEVSEVALVSVPYMEAPGLNEGHIHSRIDLQRITEWFGRAPNYHYIAKELSGCERIICVFDTTTTAHWPTLCDHCIHGLRFQYRWSLQGSSLDQESGRDRV